MNIKMHMYKFTWSIEKATTSSILESSNSIILMPPFPTNQNGSLVSKPPTSSSETEMNVLKASSNSSIANSSQQSDSESLDSSEPSRPSFRDRWNKEWNLIKHFCSVYLWPSGRPGLKFRVILAISFLIFSKVFSVISPFLLKSFFNSLTNNPTVFPFYILLTYFLLKLGEKATGQFQTAVFAPVATHALRSLSGQALYHVLNLSHSFHVHQKTGAIIRILSRGSRGVEMMIRMALFSTFPLIVEIVFVLIVQLIYFDALFALITFLTLFFYIGATVVITEWRTEIRRRENAADNKANTRSTDALSNYETVKYFNNERHEFELYDQAMAEYGECYTSTQTSLSLLNFAQQVIIQISLIITMGLAAYYVTQGKLTIGDIILLMTYTQQLARPLNFLGSSYRMVKQGLTDLEGIVNLMNQPLDIVDSTDSKNLQITRGEPLDVEFKNVRFGYSEEYPILRGISFRIPAGKTVAIVGPSGAGKSTIVKLLFRFYDLAQNHGSILVNGNDIRSLSQRSLRSYIAIVPQRIALFGDTIRYNISYGDPLQASEEKIIQASGRAQLHDFTMRQPDQYETMVSNLRLSGGETQRLGIARALLKNPSFFIADEATSSLDTITEQQIQSEINSVSQGVTTLLIAHRLSTIVHSDLIIVLKDGLVAESGKHEDLLKLQGVYSTLWNLQAQTEALHQAEKNLKNTLDAICPTNDTFPIPPDASMPSDTTTPPDATSSQSLHP